jgi:hypothetical protein
MVLTPMAAMWPSVSTWGRVATMGFGATELAGEMQWTSKHSAGHRGTRL